MSYRVDSKTLLFDDLSDVEAKFLRIQVEGIVLDGNLQNVWDSQSFRSWCEAAGYDVNNALLVMATAYPQRALISLLRRGK